MVMSGQLQNWEEWRKLIKLHNLSLDTSRIGNKDHYRYLPVSFNIEDEALSSKSFWFHCNVWRNKVVPYDSSGVGRLPIYWK